MFRKVFSLFQKPKDSRLLKGKIHNIKAWASAADRDAYLAGDQTVQPIWVCPDGPNGITDVGIHYVLEVSFRDGVAPDPGQIGTWYSGLIDNESFTGVAAGDTSASHAGWIENEDYDEAARITVAFNAAATRAITAAISWTINDTITIRGIFIISDDTKGGTTGTLFSTALFASPPSLVAGNVLTANYSLTD